MIERDDLSLTRTCASFKRFLYFSRFSFQAFYGLKGGRIVNYAKIAGEKCDNLCKIYMHLY